MNPCSRVRFLMMIFLALLSSYCASREGVIKESSVQMAAEEGKISIVKRISLVDSGTYCRIIVEGSEPIPLPFYRIMTDPLRISIDVPNIDLRQVKSPIPVENGTIREVTATQFNGKGRIEIGLVQMANYNVSIEDRILSVDIEKLARPAQTADSNKEDTKDQEPVKISDAPVAPPKKEEPSTTITEKASSPEPPPPRTKAKELLDIKVEDRKDYVVFTLLADGKIENYNAFKLDMPARLVVDLWGIDFGQSRKWNPGRISFIRNVRIGHYPEKIRIVFDSAKALMPAYRIDNLGDRLVVGFGSLPPSIEPRTEEAPTVFYASAKKSGRSGNVTRVDFKQMDNKCRIIVGTSEEPFFELKKVSKEILALEIKNARVSKRWQRDLDTSQFESAVKNIHIENVKIGKENHVKVSIALREEVRFEATQEGKLIYIDIENPKKTGISKTEIRSDDKPQAAPEKEDKETVTAPSKVEVPSIPLQPAPKPEELRKEVPAAGIPGKVYTGRRISLDFKDADIKNILRLIAEVSNLNIIAGDDVTGKITMRLTDVPWDQALDVVLQSRALGKTQVGNVVRIAPLDTLKREDQAELEARRAKERLEDLVTELIPVNYATAKDIAPQVKTVLSERGDVKVDERTNILIVKDIAKNVGAVRELVKTLDAKTPQVLIEARIVEASLTFQRELGISWGFKVHAGKETGNIGTVKGGLTDNKFVDLPAIAQSGAGTAIGTAGILQFVYEGIHALDKLDVALSAHENKGEVKVISSPKIATLDNKEASVEQGLRIPYLKLTTEGTVTTDFIDANLKLTVTPHVTNDGHIKLSIKAKKDAPDTTVTVQGVPSIDKKEAITEVLVKDGGIVVIAGIYTISKTDGSEGIPLLNRIPILGWLFKRESKEDKRKDLLIFISPKVMKDQV